MMRYRSKDINEILLNYKRIFLLLVVAYVCFIIANMYLNMEIGDFLKKSLILFICIIFLRVVAAKSMVDLIALLILMLPFPVFINFGKDLGTSITLGIYLVVSVYMLKNMMKKEVIFLYKPLFPVLIYITICYVVSFGNTPWFGRENALRNISVFVSCVAIFYMIVNNIQNRQAIFKIVDVITIMCFIESLLVIYEVLFPLHSGFINFFSSRVIDVDEMYAGMENLRIVGTIAADYELTSAFFAMNIVVQFFRIQSLKKSLKRKLYVFCLFCSSFALVSTGTRGGFVALIIAILIMLFLAKRYVSLTKNMVVIFVLGVFLVSVIFIISESMPHVSKLGERLSETQFEGVVPDHRVLVWKFVLPILAEHPWIGYGPQIIGKTGLIRYYDPHSMYFSYVFNIGILGASGIMVFLGAIFWKGFSALRKQQDSEMTHIIVGLLAAFMVFILQGLLSSYTRSNTMQQFVWIILALIVSVAKIVKNGSDEDFKTLHRS